MGIENQGVQANFISVSDACSILDQCEEKRVEQLGGMSLHWLQHDTRGEILMVQGSNGEFAVVEAA